MIALLLAAGLLCASPDRETRQEEPNPDVELSQLVSDDDAEWVDDWELEEDASVQDPWGEEDWDNGEWGAEGWDIVTRVTETGAL
jgi:hypothetical protein